MLRLADNNSSDAWWCLIMFDTCQSNAGPKCSEVAEKIVQLFGWRQTYNVEKLQRNVPDRATTRISITRSSVLVKKTEEVRSQTERFLEIKAET